MTSCCGYGDVADRQFSPKLAAQDVKRYRQKGPGPTTRLIRDCVVGAGAARGHMLDVVGLENEARRLSGNPFRSFVHRASAMTELAARQGFTLRRREHTVAWCVDLLERTGS